MAHDKRLIFVHKWLSRAKEAEDEFDQFFSAWIALIVAAQHASYSTSRHGNDTDRERVMAYFMANKTNVLRATSNCHEEMKWLAGRQGTTYANAIVDTGSPALRELFGRLSDHYRGGKPITTDDLLAKAIAELLNKVRNNVFHGAKVYDDKQDLELLRRVNPVLIAVLDESVPRLPL